MYTNKINSNNNFNKVQFKQNNDIKNKYFYVDQSAIDNFKLPLGMGLIYSPKLFSNKNLTTLKLKILEKSLNRYSCLLQVQ